MSEVTVKGNVYRAGKMNCVEQLHVVRRLGPMLVVAGISIEMLRNGMKIKLDDMIQMAGPIMEILSKMDDGDVNYVLFTCMRAVGRQQGERYAPVMLRDSNDMMFNDIDLPVMIRLVVEVLKENLSGFLTELADEPTLPSS